MPSSDDTVKKDWKEKASRPDDLKWAKSVVPKYTHTHTQTQFISAQQLSRKDSYSDTWYDV